MSIQVNVVDTGFLDNLYRARHTAHIYKDGMYVFGGIDRNSKSTNKLWYLSLSSFAWTLCTASGDIPEERSSHCSVLYQGKIYVFGGYLEDTTTRSNDLYMLNIGTMKWQKIKGEGKLPPPLYGTSAQEMNGRIYYFGGYKIDGKCINDVFTYDINSNVWNSIKTCGNLPAPREYHTSVWFKDSLIIWGGWSHKDNLLSDIYSLYIGPTTPSHPVIKANKEIVDLKSLFLEGLFADVVFKIEGQEFPAHKAIISKSCNYFYNLFTSGMAESKAAEIEFPDVKACTFKALLQFIYCNKVEIPEDYMLDLLVLSDKLSMLELKVKCEAWAVDNIMDDNFAKTSKAAETIGSDILRKAVVDFMVRNFDSIEPRGDFCSVPPSILEDVFNQVNPK